MNRRQIIGGMMAAAVAPVLPAAASEPAAPASKLAAAITFNSGPTPRGWYLEEMHSMWIGGRKPIAPPATGPIKLSRLVANLLKEREPDCTHYLRQRDEDQLIHQLLTRV